MIGCILRFGVVCLVLLLFECVIALCCLLCFTGLWEFSSLDWWSLGRVHRYSLMQLRILCGGFELIAYRVLILVCVLACCLL